MDTKHYENAMLDVLTFEVIGSTMTDTIIEMRHLVRQCDNLQNGIARDGEYLAEQFRGYADRVRWGYACSCPTSNSTLQTIAQDAALLEARREFLFMLIELTWGGQVRKDFKKALEGHYPQPPKVES